jgi:excisionase family DNA binding protein
VTEDRLMTATEVAERLCVSKSWVLEAARSGTIPHLRLGRYVRFQWSAVQGWLETCAHPGRPINFRREVRQ